MADVSDLRIDHSATPRSGSRVRGVIAALFVLILLLGVGATAWFATRPTPLAEIATSSAPPPVANQAPAPQAQTGFTAAGYIEVIPPGARMISSPIPGMLNDIRVQEGQSISAGEVIATLDTALLEQELIRSEAEIEVLRARLARLEAGYLPEEIAQAEARATAAVARLEIEQERLAAQRELVSAGIVSEQFVLDAQMQVVEAVRALAEAKANLSIKQRGFRPEDIQIARAELGRAEVDRDYTNWKLDRCAIASPVEGVVFQQLAQPGQWVGDETAIMSVFDPDALQAWVDVNQRDLARIRIGQRVTMVADGAPRERIEGQVYQFMPRASIERNTVRIKISIEGEHQGLRPDMSLRVTFHE